MRDPPWLAYIRARVTGVGVFQVLVASKLLPASMCIGQSMQYASRDGHRLNPWMAQGEAKMIRLGLARRALEDGPAGDMGHDGLRYMGIEAHGVEVFVSITPGARRKSPGASIERNPE